MASSGAPPPRHGTAEVAMQADEGVRDVGVRSAKAGAIDVDEVIEGGRGGAVVGLSSPSCTCCAAFRSILPASVRGSPSSVTATWIRCAGRNTRGRGDRQTIGLGSRLRSTEPALGRAHRHARRCRRPRKPDQHSTGRARWRRCRCVDRRSWGSRAAADDLDPAVRIQAPRSPVASRDGAPARQVGRRLGIPQHDVVAVETGHRPRRPALGARRPGPRRPRCRPARPEQCGWVTTSARRRSPSGHASVCPYMTHQFPAVAATLFGECPRAIHPGRRRPGPPGAAWTGPPGGARSRRSGRRNAARWTRT